jgi:ribosomal protein S18 acetylase RimI-like enzyme
VNTRAIISRSLRPDDVAGVAALLARSRDDPEMTFFDPFPLTEETARRLACEPRLDRYYVAEVSSELIGLSMLRGWDEGYDIPSFGVMVDPAWHGRGVGSALTDFTIASAVELGCEAIRLSVYARNERASRMYVQRGFTTASREPVTRTWGSDERIVMVKPLQG